jgi:hypothetical protein
MAKRIITNLFKRIFYLFPNAIHLKLVKGPKV